MSGSNWMATYTGKAFHFDEMDPDSICIEDIAHALSNICRFSGHCPRHYSVAQHSMLVASLCPENMRLTALLHDATEAYIGDMVTPLKRIIPEFKDYEEALWFIIALKFKIQIDIPEEVHQADAAALSIEAKYLMGVNPELWGLQPAAKTFSSEFGVEKMSPKQAEKLFLKEYYKYAEK